MLLRPFRRSDLETLCAIDQACFPPDISYSREELTSFIARRGSRTWVAEEGGAIVGFLIADRQPGKVGHIVTIDVVEPSRRHGVGSKLMDAAEQWARAQGLVLIYLETAADNLAAQRFYAARGYRRLRKVEHYYRNGLAAWVMVKELAQQSKVES
jgi:ribosomal protein S18 acetylase RimI-like enzyme